MTGKRKRDWDETSLKQIEQLAGFGLTVKEIAAVMGLSNTAFYDHANNVEPLILEHLAAGRAKSKGMVGQSLHKQAVAGNVNAIKWFEMTRCDYSEKQEQKTTQYVVEVPPKSKSVEEWEAEYGNKDDADKP